jgi:hypothetical protein
MLSIVSWALAPAIVIVEKHREIRAIRSSSREGAWKELLIKEGENEGICFDVV